MNLIDKEIPIDRALCVHAVERISTCHKLEKHCDHGEEDLDLDDVFDAADYN